MLLQFVVFYLLLAEGLGSWSPYDSHNRPPKYEEPPTYPQASPQYHQPPPQYPPSPYKKYPSEAPPKYPAMPPVYSEAKEPPMPYSFGFEINDGYGNKQTRNEEKDSYGKVTGSYSYWDAYGIYRLVDYVADTSGFRARIKTNEPGTANQNPADVEIIALDPPSYQPPAKMYPNPPKAQYPMTYPPSPPNKYPPKSPPPSPPEAKYPKKPKPEVYVIPDDVAEMYEPSKYLPYPYYKR